MSETPNIPPSGAPAQQPAAADGGVEQFGYKQELNRVLGFWDLLVYGMLFMVPTAPMGIFGFVSESAFGMVPLVYCVGIFAMVFTALAYSRLSSAFPIAGSVYAYVQRGINPHVGWVGGWAITLDYIMIPALLYSFVGTWLASLFPAVPMWIFALVLVAIVTALNFFGIKITATANWVIFAIQAVVLVIFLVIGWQFIAAGPGFTIAPFYQPGKIDPGFIATAASIAVLSFLGFDGISTLAEETRNPRKTVGRATIAALFLIGFLFILLTYTAQAAVPDQVNQVPGWDPTIGFFQVAGVIGGTFLFQATIWSQIIGAGVGNTITAMAAISRILYSMGRDGMLPRIFAQVHPKYQTPWFSIFFMAAFSFVLSIFLPMDVLTKFVNFGALTGFMILNFTVFWYFFIRLRRRNASGIFNYVLLPFVGIGILAFVWWGFDEWTKYLGITWVALGIIYGFFKSRGYKEVPEAFQNVAV